MKNRWNSLETIRNETLTADSVLFVQFLGIRLCFRRPVTSPSCLFVWGVQQLVQCRQLRWMWEMLVSVNTVVLMGLLPLYFFMALYSWLIPGHFTAATETAMNVEFSAHSSLDLPFLSVFVSSLSDFDHTRGERRVCFFWRESTGGRVDTHEPCEWSFCKLNVRY